MIIINTYINNIYTYYDNSLFASKFSKFFNFAKAQKYIY